MLKRLAATLILTLLFMGILNGTRIFIGAESSTSRLDNLIITVADLEPAASRLAQWKNSCGIPSRVLDVEWINSTYNGVDKPEKIRNCIKDFHFNSQIEYVTIFGDSDRVPTRYVYVPDQDDDFTATDLYYADLDGTWDDNHDGLYADQRYDTVEGIPEVCVGRIPVTLVEYSQPIVDKIINYKQQFDPAQDWTKRVVLAAGTGNNGEEDLHGTGYTVLNEFIANVTRDKEVVKLYEKDGNLSTDRMASEINRGCLFVNFAGHGDPDTTPIFSAGWLFYWVVAPIWWNGFGIVDVRSTMNGARLPVVTTCSCSTARFDDSDCIGEWFVGHPNGGAIAYFGSTRISYSCPNASSPYGYMGEMDRRIYENFYAGHTKLGEMWSETVKGYVQSYVQNYTYAYNIDAKTIMEFVLLGDPTLKIYNGPQTLKVPEDYNSIQAAINDAYDGDTIEVAPGTYYENLTVNKTVSLVGRDRETTKLDTSEIQITSHGATIYNFTLRNNNRNCIYLSNVYGCNISRNTIGSSDIGILLVNSSYNQVTDNSVTNCSCGILSDYFSCSNVISYNKISKNGNGVCLFDWCYNNIVSHNTISDNYGYGLWMANSTFNRVSENNFARNKETNVFLIRTFSNYIEDNYIGYSSYGGIVLQDSSNNTLVDNTIAGNEFGLVADFSTNNVVHHNNFIENAQQAIVHPSNSSANLWDNEYPSCGNYWSDYEGEDLQSGRYRNETGSDGIGDIPYVLDEKNQDRWPFLIPYQTRDIAVVNVSISGTITFPSWPPWLPHYQILLSPYLLYINAAIENRGNRTETAIVRIYANSTVIGNISLIVPPFSTEALGTEWNATGFAGECTISVYAEPLLGEEDIMNNRFTYGNVWVQPTPSAYVIVSSSIFDNLTSYVDRYIADLGKEGTIATAYRFSGNSTDLRKILRDGYSNGLKGALFVGDIPTVWYEMDTDWGYEEFPTDLFYMDLHGEWADTDGNGVYDRHTGNWSADIWVGRIKASGMAENEISLVKNYFDKDHNFRTGALSLPNNALTYVDDDWVGESSDIDYAVSLVYNNRTLVKDKTVTNPADYLSRLAQNWNLVQVSVHGWSTGHAFKVNGEWDGDLYSSDIRSSDPRAFFYNLFSCSNARYSVTDYIAGWYIFSHSYGLAAISSTKTGGMLFFDDFYREFRNNTLGESFLYWLNQRIIVEKTHPDFWYDSKWYYGMTIIGDPTLYSAYNSTVSLKQSQPSTDHELTSPEHDASLPSAVLHVSSTKGFNQYSSIQEAIDAANLGDTIEVAPGIYEEHLIVNKPVTIVGQDPNSVLVVSNETGPIFLITADNVTLDSLTIKALPTGNLEIDQFPIQTGIAIYSDNNVVQNNNIIDCDIGIELSHVYGNALNNNQINNASQSGINARYSAQGNVTGNVIENSLVGAYFLECQNTTFSNNAFLNSTYETIRCSSDVSITRVKTLKTVLCQAYAMPIEVTVENHGNFSATFDVTLCANGTAMSTVPNITVQSGDSKVLTFNWSTIDWAIGNYTIWVSIRPIPGETNTADNNFTDGWVIVSLAGDITGSDGWPDGKVDMRDVGLVARNFGQTVPPANPNCDLTGPTASVPDGKIDMRDIGLVARHFGEHYP